jgi:hypothetical protein
MRKKKKKTREAQKVAKLQHILWSCRRRGGNLPHGNDLDDFT